MKDSNRKKLEAAAWRRTHADYKGRAPNGNRCVMWRGKVYALEEMSVEELEQYIGN